MENSVYIRKRYLLLGVLALLFLFTLPLAVYLAQQQSQTETNAATPTDVPQVCTTNPQDIALVIDNSSSMLDYLDDGVTTRLDEAKKAAHAFVDIIRKANANITDANNRFHVTLVRFSDFSSTDTRPPGYDGPMNTAMVRKLTSNMDNIDTGIDSMSPPEYMGWTCVECGLREAYTELGKSSRPAQNQTVIVMTDGVANWRHNTTNWVLETYGDAVDYPDDSHPIARQAAYKQVTNHPGVTVYAIGTSDSSTDFINKLASLGGTSGKFTSDPRGLTQIYKDIASQLVVKGQGAITGTVFEDTHNLGTRDADEKGRQGVLVGVYDANGKLLKKGTTDANGVFTITGLCPGTYTVKDLDVDWSATTTNPVQVPLGQSTTGSFVIGVHYAYTIQGKVYVDNGDSTFNASTDAVYPGPVKITYDSSSPITSSSFAISNVTQGGSHTITLDPASVPGYTIKPGSVYTINLSTYPTSGCPSIKPSAYINYGYSCSKHALVLNFLLIGKPVVAPSTWLQSETLDVRIDAGYVDFPIPAATSCPAYSSLAGSSSTPGIIFTGDADAKFGAGQASVKNWVVGGGAYPETFASGKPLKLSYDSAYAAAVKDGNMKELFTFGQSTPPGIYHIGGALAITDKIHIAKGDQYILLVENGVDIENEITVDPGGFLLIVSKSSITITGNIGTTPSCSSATSQLDGIFVADNSITFENAKTCADGGDTMLQASGTFVANAGRVGGKFIQKRTLCDSNATFPTLRVTPRLDMVMSFPDFLKSTSRIWQEVAP